MATITLQPLNVSVTRSRTSTGRAKMVSRRAWRAVTHLLSTNLRNLIGLFLCVSLFFMYTSLGEKNRVTEERETARANEMAFRLSDYQNETKVEASGTTVAPGVRTYDGNIKQVATISPQSLVMDLVNSVRNVTTPYLSESGTATVSQSGSDSDRYATTHAQSGRNYDSPQEAIVSNVSGIVINETSLDNSEIGIGDVNANATQNESISMSSTSPLFDTQGNNQRNSNVMYIKLMNQIFLQYGQNRSHYKNNEDKAADIENSEYERKEKLILFWTHVYGSPAFFAGDDRFKQCKFSNCRITNDKDLLGDSEAVVFHLWDLLKNRDFPSTRSSSQKWILFGREPPAVLKLDHTFANIFNSTYTFRKDSDIVFNYGDMVKRRDILTPSIYLLRKHNIAHGKTRLVAWIVSNCDAPSKRDEYVKELQKYVPVDIYGRCGNYKCGSKLTQLGRLKCNVMLRKTYKFYLSFENSICEDFITEKVYKCFNYDVIPVVLGGADYVADLPPKSYLNVKDFASPKDLARRMVALDQDDFSYNKYFEWKLNYEYRVKNHFCDLCAYIHQQAYSSKSYNRIDKWWNRCTDPGLFYTGAVSSM